MPLQRHFVFFCILTVIALGSCSVEKRIYRPGYHFTWNHTSPGQKINSSKQADSIPDISITASADDVSPVIPEKKIIVPDSCGDMINLRSGTTINTKVLEITPEQIKYKRCDNLEGPTYTVNKNEVASIAYHNGMKEEFEAQPKVYQQQAQTVPPQDYQKSYAERSAKTSKKFGVAALIVSLGFLLFLGFGLWGLLSIGVLAEVAAFLLFSAFISLVVEIGRASCRER